MGKPTLKCDDLTCFVLRFQTNGVVVCTVDQREVGKNNHPSPYPSCLLGRKVNVLISLLQEMVQSLDGAKFNVGVMFNFWVICFFFAFSASCAEPCVALLYTYSTCTVLLQLLSFVLTRAVLACTRLLDPMFLGFLVC